MIKRYLQYVKEYKNTALCKKYGITNYTINDGLVDVDGDVDISSKGLSSIPVKFGKVSGYFYCGYNKLVSLEGCPESVGGYFNCDNNKLVSLEGSPESIGGNFDCDYNKLASLEGSPKSVGGNFNCYNNKLVSLGGCPRSVGHFYCNNNPIEKIWNLFKDFNLIELFNDYDVIQDGVVIMSRLNSFLLDIGGKEIKKQIKL